MEAKGIRFLQWLREGQGKRLVLLLGAGGMLLILLSEWLPSPGAEQKAASGTGDTAAAYKVQLEQQLSGLIGQMDGAGKTQVMVTLETGDQTVYAVDTKTGEGSAEQTHVLTDGGALAETVYTPAVQGVAVVCEGGDQIHVIAQITEMLSALLGLSTSRISVTKMN